MNHKLIAIAALIFAPAVVGAQATKTTQYPNQMTARRDTVGHRYGATRKHQKHSKRASSYRGKAAVHRDTSRGDVAPPVAGATNQTQTGVTNTKTGASTLGPNVKKVTPTQGAAVTSKGDVLKRGGDSVKKQRRP
jgi:hypothetical protein